MHHICANGAFTWVVNVKSMASKYMVVDADKSVDSGWNVLIKKRYLLSPTSILDFYGVPSTLGQTIKMFMSRQSNL